MNYSNIIKIYLLYILIVLGGVNYTYGQTAIPDKYLSAEDKEKLGKIEKANKKVRQLSREAESIYSKIKDLKEKNLNDESERIKELRNQALKKDIEGFEKKKEANRLLYNIYQRHFKSFDEKTGNNLIDTIIEAQLQHEKASEFFYIFVILTVGKKVPQIYTHRIYFSKIPLDFINLLSNITILTLFPLASRTI